MSDDHDLDWYRARWNELVDVLAVEDSDAVVAEVRRLRKQAEALSVQHEALAEAGLENPEKALRMIDNMADQLEELYAEREHPELPVKPEEKTDETSG
jgi:CRP-like cAMP-binding protein